MWCKTRANTGGGIENGSRSKYVWADAGQNKVLQALRRYDPSGCGNVYALRQAGGGAGRRGTAVGRYSEYQYEHQYSGGSGCRCRGKGKKQMDGVCSVSAFGLLWRAQILRGKGRDGRTLSVYVGPFWDRMVCRPYRSAHKNQPVLCLERRRFIALKCVLTTLIISKKPGNTGISRDIRTEFTTDLLLSD